MASLDNNPVLEKGTALRIGSWIFIADGSGGFEICSTDQDPPEVSEGVKRREFDEFIDQLEEIGFSNLNNAARIQPEFDAIKAKTLSELEVDLEKLLKDSKQETPMDGKTMLPNYTCVAEPSLWKKKSKASFKKTTRKRKPSNVTFSNINNIDEKIEHCLQLAEDTFNINTSREEFYNQWNSNSTELEQDQAFIKYLEEMDEPIFEDEIAEWSHDIDLFMEGLTNPDKLEALWEQSKVNKLWDDSQNKSLIQLDQYLSQSHPAEVCFTRRLHKSLVQRHPNSKFTYPARKSSHAVAIFSGKT